MLAGDQKERVVVRHVAVAGVGHERGSALEPSLSLSRFNWRLCEGPWMAYP